MYVENNAMHVNPKQKMMHEKKIFGQILKNLIKSGRFKQKFLIAISIGRVTGSIDQKFGKISFFFFFFEKQSILMRKLLKAHCIMNKMHEYGMKFFSKILEFNLDLPKTRFSINLPSNLKL